MSTTESSYDRRLLERHNQYGPGRPSSGRGDFGRDRDRILYSSAFRTLDGKTQVVASYELGNAHNRLTHSLKVGQLGESIARRLNSVARGPDPYLVHAACLAHDIGHPPFGHAGEDALASALDKARRAELGLVKGEEAADALDGFEGNAQNLRVLTYLAVHSDVTRRGLHLTRATLAAATKYPWARGQSGKTARKWGAYKSEIETLDWITEYRPAGLVRSIEADLMDWCDDVTYAVHDMEDFYRLGLIPLHNLFNFDLAADHPSAGRDATDDLLEFLAFAATKWDESEYGAFDQEGVVQLLHVLADNISVSEPFRPTRRHKGLLRQTVTDLISYFADCVDFDGRGCGYDGALVVPKERRLLCDVLKLLIWKYVIARPEFARQQVGQERIIESLVTWLLEQPERLLPEDRREELDQHGDAIRAVADHIASLTESSARHLYRKLSGQDLGAFTDAI